MADVFLSYQKRDRELAERMAGLLRGAGLSVWWDDDLTPRESWDRIIEREIALADYVLVLWTRNSVESDWVRIEANYAKNCHPSKLVQARFDGSNVPMAFSMIQYVDLKWADPRKGPSWPRLLEWLGDGAPTVQDARPEPSPHHPQPLSAGRRTPMGDAWSRYRAALTRDWNAKLAFQPWMLASLVAGAVLSAAIFYLFDAVGANGGLNPWGLLFYLAFPAYGLIEAIRRRNDIRRWRWALFCLLGMFAAVFAGAALSLMIGKAAYAGQNCFIFCDGQFVMMVAIATGAVSVITFLIGALILLLRRGWRQWLLMLAIAFSQAGLSVVLIGSGRSTNPVPAFIVWVALYCVMLASVAEPLKTRTG